MKISLHTIVLTFAICSHIVPQAYAALSWRQTNIFNVQQAQLEKAIKTCNIEMLQNLATRNHDLIVNALAGQRAVTPLMLAAEIGDPAIVAYLLENKASIWCTDAKGQNVFHYWTKATRNTLITIEDRIQVLKHLMKEERALAVASLQDDNGWTPLHHACFYEQEALVEALISYLHPNALNIPDHAGKTPLYTVIERKNERLMALLIAKDATYMLRAKDGTSVYQIAAQKGLLEPLVIYIVRHKSEIYSHQPLKKASYEACERRACHQILIHVLNDFDQQSKEYAWLLNHLA